MKHTKNELLNALGHLTETIRVIQRADGNGHLYLDIVSENYQLQDFEYEVWQGDKNALFHDRNQFIPSWESVDTTEFVSLGDFIISKVL